MQAPWFVDHVDLDVPNARVDIWLEHEAGRRWAYPHCQRELASQDQAGERTWQHLDNVVTYCRHPVANAMAEGCH